MDWKDVLLKYNELTKQANMTYKKKLLQKADIDLLNDFVLLSCYVLFPPRRLMDYGLMKIRGYDEKEDNYMTKGKMVFNQYKTKGKYGTQTFEMGKEFEGIVKKWAKLNDSDYLIVSKNGKGSTSPQMNAKLNSIFGGKAVSANMLRHSYISHFYSGQMPSYTEMENLSEKMAHGVNTALMYIKKD